jgi:hypothetical protein
MRTILAGLAALAIATTATAASAADAVRPIEQLSAAERARLPDSTPVTVGKTTATLGQLRKAHQGVVERFSALTPAALQVMSNAAGLVPSKTIVEPASGYKDGAADMQAFCNAKKATVCLYYPAKTTLWMGGGWADEVDPFITDPQVCHYQNGIVLAGGCQYNYPTWYTINFKVGLKGFTTKVECDPAFWKAPTIDQHGAIAVQTTAKEGTNFTTGAKASTCVIYATLN